MPTPAEIISTVASLMNDTAQTSYTDVAVLPYLNMALRNLQEEFEANNIPVTNQTSIAISVPVGVTVIRFPVPGQEEALPELPVDLVEIQRLWESPYGLSQWIPMTKREFIPHYVESEVINQFLIWAWINQEIRLPLSNAINDVKIDYISSMFRTIAESQLQINFPFINIHSYLSFKTAALCSRYIGENSTRADGLDGEAIVALNRSMGISTKGRQAITTRRRPFRAGYKRTGW